MRSLSIFCKKFCCHVERYHPNPHFLFRV